MYLEEERALVAGPSSLDRAAGHQVSAAVACCLAQGGLGEGYDP